MAGLFTNSAPGDEAELDMLYEPPDPPEHTVSNDYKRWLRKQWRAKRRGEEFETGPPKSPFGKALGMDPQYLDDKLHRHTNHTKRLLPIQGPPNWDQIWDSNTVGQDILLQDPGIKKYLKSDKRYRTLKLVEELGSGTFGVVYKARIGTPGNYEYLACKRTKYDMIYNNVHTAVREMLGDVLALRYLEHENVVTIIDYLTIPDRKTGFPFAAVFMFMELCDGNLKDDILELNNPNGTLPPELCLHWFRDICTAVQYIHSKHVVHFDIKPANILFTYRDGARPTGDFKWRHILRMIFKLGDFGLAFQFREEDSPYTISEARGTELYRAPEMRNVQAGYLAKPCDIYSLATCLTDSYVGKPLYFQYHPYLNTAIKKASQGMGPFSWCDNKWITGLIVDMSAPNPTDRLTIEEVMKRLSTPG